VITEESGGTAGRSCGLEQGLSLQHVCRAKYGCDTRIFSRWPIVDRARLLWGRRRPGRRLGDAAPPGGDFTVVGNHFVWPIPPAAGRPRAGLLAGKDRAAFPKDSLIVTGDFNSTPWSWSLRRQDKALGLERRTRALASWPTGEFSRLASAPFPILPIDHVYAGKAWKTVKVERGPSLGSDHRPDRGDPGPLSQATKKGPGFPGPFVQLRAVGRSRRRRRSWR
jgi:endonuclease/exonuclease/phosphatase (EEP) superfamily protein YafD